MEAIFIMRVNGEVSSWVLLTIVLLPDEALQTSKDLLPLLLLNMCR